ncbi:MAG: tetratricopeptide repeat protein [Vicinamibacterales bacterium]
MEVPCVPDVPWPRYDLDVDPEDRVSLLRFVAALSNLGDRSVKRDALRWLLGTSPHRAIVQFQLAFMAQEEQQWGEAAAALEDALTREPDFLDAHAHLAYVYEREQRWDLAAQSYGRVYHMLMQRARSRFPLLDQQGSADGAPQANDLRDAWLRRQPYFRSTLLALSGVFSRLDRWDAAALWLRRAIELDPGDPELLERVLAALSSAPSETRRRTLQAIESVSRHPARIISQLLVIDIEEQRVGPLVDDLRRLIDLGHGAEEFVEQALAAVTGVADRDLRRRALLSLLEVAGPVSTVLFHLAYMNQEDGRWDEAAANLEAALIDDPDRDDVLAHLAYVSERRQRWSDVEAFSARLLQKDPTNAEAWAARGRALESLIRYGEAETCYAAAVRLQPDRSDLWTRLWFVRDRAGDATGAAQACVDALARRPGDPDHELQLIAALHACGDASGALARCRTLREAGCPDVPWSRFMDVLGALVRVPPRPLPDKSWQYFHYDRDKTLALLEAALLIRDQFPQTPRVFVSQGLIAWEKTMGFLNDERFRQCVDRYNHLRMMVNWEWNLHVIQWAARQALHVPGDFVELGVYRGFTTAVTADNIDFASIDKRWYLYDTFAGIPADQRTDGWPHAYGGRDSDQWFGEVVDLFSSYANISVIRGRVPEVFAESCPDRIAFVHIDLNSAPAELGALEKLFDRLSPGAVVVFDDYGWYTARDQFDAENRWMADRGLSILELPTGQGLFIKAA